MEVRQIRLEMLESACRAMEMAEQLRETDPLTARALERASLRYWVGGTGMDAADSRGARQLPAAREIRTR